jgi:Fe-S-cluster-containing dehydrogenase component/formate-dependent nitrite reductase membrane component NrfD
MQYGFLIDHTRCIGCHACTVACKSENSVPVGNFRTWVKYVEKGTYPVLRRHFAVLRCNHCTNAPCVTICPVNALEKRKDGIVDIDRDACIGCRACMQACPYDAIALNEDTGSVEKCHYCAHRVEVGLKPACVVVCPEEAIVHGDLHDPTSRIARMVKENETLVRRPEQRTGPNVHYVGVEALAIEPGMPVRPSTYLWSDRPPHKPEAWPAELATAPDTRVVLDAGHKVEWRWPVAAYLVTKGIAAGVAMLAPFVLTSPGWLPEAVALFFTAITTFLLVEDLARPLKFLTLLTRPNTKSWLVRGAWILIAFSISVPLALVVPQLRWLDVGLGAGVAGYTAFLFAQCEGRDLWQSRVLLPHLLAQSLACGAAVLAPFAVATGSEPLAIAILRAALVVFGALSLYEWRGPHPTNNAKQAAAFLGTLRFGPVPALFTSLVCSVVIPVLFGGSLGYLLPVFVLTGVALYEWAYVRAAQLPPLS